MGPTYAGIIIFSYLRTNIKDLSNNLKQSKKALKEYAFVYTSDEIFMCKIR